MTDTTPITGAVPATKDEACSCCDTTDAVTATGSSTAASSGSTVATYTVSGMTCGHCVSAVSTEIGTLTGVTGVDVDLGSGAVTVTSEAPLVTADVAAAVDEAGYELVVGENDAGPGR